MTDKYPMFGADRLARWQVLPGWDRLHRVTDLVWSDRDMIGGPGRTACGRSGYLQIPGPTNRRSIPRCAHCCRMTGTPRGNGNPENEINEGRK